ncbi:unnamed protein product [Moneuplotes crassus]|uniref:histidine kinase n=1 Tax=Euplotes crassus TaxID=5936 RepID=A0AAD1XZB0_EUPCR|nr:unnamed protein product [Moneuplotes crassus]
MEEVKYHQRFHQTNMSHALSIFKKSKFLMIVLLVLRFICEETCWPAIGITFGYVAMMACTQKLEKSNIANKKSVLLMAHLITFVKVLTSISATIRKNQEFPRGLSLGVTISFLLTMESIKSIEPDYRKAIGFFIFYWSIYLCSLCAYYWIIQVEEILTFFSLFYLVYEIYKENYFLSNSLTEIFYDFTDDPVIIYDDADTVKCNGKFIQTFGNLLRFEKVRHHSQMLTRILNPKKIIFELKKEEKVRNISLLDIFENECLDVNKKEVVLCDGEERVFMVTLNKLENLYHSKTVLMLKETTDIHKLNLAKSQVEFRSVIMGCLTHELRTPANCAISILDTLRDYVQDSSEARKLMSICKSTIELLKSLTEDFIDFTRFENNRGFPIEKQEVNLHDFFNEIENIFVFQAEEKGIVFEINMDASIPEVIWTDPKRLKQIILNLLGNSFKFTQTGKIAINLYAKKVSMRVNPLELGKNRRPQMVKTIVHHPNLDKFGRVISRGLCDTLVKTRSAINKVRFDPTSQQNSDCDSDFSEESYLHKFLHIEVFDTGCGMDKKTLSKLFTKFKTGNNSSGLNTNGLGLGLYLSKEISEKLGGDISCDSVNGQGSTFLIRLPFDSLKEVESLLKSIPQSRFEKTSMLLTGLQNQEVLSEFSSQNGPLVGFEKMYYSKPLKKMLELGSSKEISPQNTEESKDIISIPNSVKSSSMRKLVIEESKFEVDPSCDCKILVVDDSPFNILSIEMMLKSKFNIGIEKAFSGEQAINAVKEKLKNPCCNIFSLIIMDYYMPPGINGAEAASKIREILGDKDYKIVCLTSQKEGDFNYNKSLTHFDQFFSKPLKCDEMAELIRSIY